MSKVRILRITGVIAWAIFFMLGGINMAVAGAEGADERAVPVCMTVKADSRDNATTSLAFSVKNGECFRVELYAAGGTGYQWQLMNEELQLLDVADQSVSPVEKEAKLMGGRVRTVFVLKAKPGVTGKETLAFSLRRSWQPKEMAIKNILCEVTVK